MNFFEIIYSAFSAIIGNKLRTVLTMLGMVIGISAVIIILSLGNGFKHNIEKELDNLGMDEVIVSASYNKDGDIYRLKDEDIELIKNQKKVIAVVTEGEDYIDKAFKSFNNIDINIFLKGVNQDYSKIKKYSKLLYGNYISKDDVENKNYVATIGNEDAKRIFGYENAVGKKINIKTDKYNKTFIITGVIEDIFNIDFSDLGIYANIVIPISCIQDMKDDNYKEIETLVVKVEDKEYAKEFSHNIINLLKIIYKDGEFFSWALSEMISESLDIINIFSLFLSFVASISLLVGGIGIMNIMLVSVTERTKEIGIRKSIGATNFNIKIQFLVESIVISIIGGLIGILLGYIGSIFTANILNKISEISIIPFISISNILIVAIICLIIGTIFGVYPAIKASKLDPVEALTFE